MNAGGITTLTLALARPDIKRRPPRRWAERMGSPKSLDAMAVADEFERWAKNHPQRMKWPD
jgi:hypothetical protein